MDVSFFDTCCELYKYFSNKGFDSIQKGSAAFKFLDLIELHDNRYVLQVLQGTDILFLFLEGEQPLKSLPSGFFRSSDNPSEDEQVSIYVLVSDEGLPQFKDKLKSLGIEAIKLESLHDAAMDLVRNDKSGADEGVQSVASAVLDYALQCDEKLKKKIKESGIDLLSVEGKTLDDIQNHIDLYCYRTMILHKIRIEREKRKAQTSSGLSKGSTNRGTFSAKTFTHKSPQSEPHHHEGNNSHKKASKIGDANKTKPANKTSKTNDSDKNTDGPKRIVVELSTNDKSSGKSHNNNAVNNAVNSKTANNGNNYDGSLESIPDKIDIYDDAIAVVKKLRWKKCILVEIKEGVDHTEIFNMCANNSCRTTLTRGSYHFYEFPASVKVDFETFKCVFQGVPMWFIEDD